MADLRLVLNSIEANGDDEEDENYEDNEDNFADADEDNNDLSNNSNSNSFSDALGSSLDVVTPEELFTPLTRLRSYSVSDSVFNRRTITHDVPNILATLEDLEDFITAITCIVKLSEDLEPSVRVELMEQLPYITQIYFTKMNYEQVNMYHTTMISILVRYLTDVNNQVRKTCHLALVEIMECGYLTSMPFQEHILPVLSSLTSQQHAPDDYRTEAVALGCKICKILGNDFTVEHFLPTFLTACKDSSLFHIRQVCAANIAGLSEVLIIDTIKDKLLPRFEELCTDNVWGVRKSCAECFPEFAKYFSDDILSGTLSPLFSGLLSDQSRWVRIAAFESLGPFIATFADSTKANIESLSNLNSNEINTETDNTFNSFSYWREPLPTLQDDEFIEILKENNNATNGQEILESVTSENNSGMCGDDNVVQQIDFLNSKLTENNKKFSILDDSEKENELPKNLESKTNKTNGSKGNQIDVQPGDNSGESKENQDVHVGYNEYINNSSANVESENQSENDFDNINANNEGYGVAYNNYTDKNSVGMYVSYEYGINSSNYGENNSIDYRMFGSLSDMSYPRDDMKHTAYGESKNISDSLQYETKKQNVIPQGLLDNFLSMTDPSRRQTVDCEIAKHCAFSLPGVAYTLGKDNWHCLKDVYQKLASDVQWKVRHTIASSIHELAKILGEEITRTDLVPVFNGFLKDLDEVRIGVLRHLSEFLQLLNPKIRGVYLYQLTDFLNIDNSRNWRFRSELSKQLSRITELYGAEETNNYICPVALRLTSDKVVAVQENAIELIVTLLIKLHSAIGIEGNEVEMSKHFDAFVDQIITHLAKSAKWKDRRLYCNLCALLVRDNLKIPEQIIVSHFVPQLHKLSSDKIVNVRICCARALHNICLSSTKSSYKIDNIVSETLVEMAKDPDADVRYFANVNITNENEEIEK